MALFIHPPEVSSFYAHRRETPSRTVSNNELRNAQNHVVLRSRSKIVRIKVYSRIKGLEDRVTNLEPNVSLYGQFSAPVKPTTTYPPKQKKEDEERQNYYVNTGYAIRTLREEFPALFYRELTFDIYRDDIVFKDPLNTFVGIENYKTIFWALRFHGKIFFRALRIDISSVWQPVDKNMIMIRWTVHSIPRIPWESRGRFDGTSEYKLDKNGKIYEHRVHNIVLNTPPKLEALVMGELIQSLGCPSTPKPTYFEVSSSSTGNILPLSVNITGLNHHLASPLAFARRAEADPSQRT